jgi:hypothetical protein
MLRENYSDEIKSYDEINEENIKLIGDEKFHFLFCETKHEKCKKTLVYCLKTDTYWYDFGVKPR